MLLGLRHRAVGSRNHQNRAVHLSGTSDHVLHIIGVAWAIDVRIVALVGLILDVGRRNRDSALALFRSFVDVRISGELGFAALGKNLGDRCSQRRLAMVDVTNGADVHVRLRPLEI